MKSESNSLIREDRIEPFQRRHSLNTPRSGGGTSKFNLPINTTRRINSVSFDITPIDEHDTSRFPLGYITSRDRYSNSLRRMSAPELPPIADRLKNSPIPQLVTNNRRISYSTRTSGSIPHSGTSDGSGRGILAKSPQSGVSSSSSNGQNQATSRLVNGHKLGNRTKTWCVPEQTETGDTDNHKLEYIKNKKNTNMNGNYTPRSLKNGYRSSRLSSKENSYSSGNNNSGMNPPASKKSLTHCKSDSKIVPIDELQKQRTFVKTKSSNNIFQRQKTLSVDKTENLVSTRQRSTGNLNGMRKYSSQLVLNSNNSGNMEDNNADSDSDPEKDQYIIDWIIGVANEDIEPPPEPEIEYHDAPPQTDTAVHIVYNED